MVNVSLNYLITAAPALQTNHSDVHSPGPFLAATPGSLRHHTQIR